jgi:hypothetical protein
LPRGLAGKYLEGIGQVWRSIGATKLDTMRTIKILTGAFLAGALLSGAFMALAADNKADAKIIPYTLKVCVVSGDKLGEMCKPYVFTNDTREIKLCCKSCLKDFKKDPKKYIKKIEEAEAKEKAKARKS